MNKNIMKGTIIITICCIITITIIYALYKFYTTKITPQHHPNKTCFGQVFTDHMFIMDWNEKDNWHNQRIVPYQPFSINPASLHMHYGQEIFEGMKAFFTDNKQTVIFRPYDHLTRFNQSARIMCMPEIEVNSTLKWIIQLIKTDNHWVPETKGHSLYIRPTMIATESTLNLKPSSTYTFFVILSPVASLYESGFNPIAIMTADNYTRSSVGGVGMAKTGGNYAASMRAQAEAHKKGYAQVLWLDSIKRKFVEEVGSMNIFFVIDNILVTPILTNTILPGITRKTVIELANKWRMPIEERKISIDEVISGIQTGRLTEAFGTGTAAGITPIGKLAYKDHVYCINNNITGSLTQKFYNEFMHIRYGSSTENEMLTEIV